jgi:hypothetical protein
MQTDSSCLARIRLAQRTAPLFIDTFRCTVSQTSVFGTSNRPCPENGFCAEPHVSKLHNTIYVSNLDNVSEF